MTRCILSDIEGTTTSLSFVQEVLFPYAARHLEAFVQEHGGEPQVQQALQEAARTLREEGLPCQNSHEVTQGLLRWIKEDRKHAALKKLQGMLWRKGYESGEYRSHIYPDVPPAFEAWRKRGLDIGIYSSGSVEAQQLLFRYSEAGDLTRYISHYFDTAVGHKREAGSYRRIAGALQLAPASVLFLSDVEAELDAAAEAGMQAAQALREGVIKTEKHPVVKDFREIFFQ